MDHICRVITPPLESWDAFPNKAREVRILIRSASAFVDSAALLEFGEGETTGGEEVPLA
jgi:hypothetical protein